MLSRVADSIYWLARYVERADHLARFVDVTREFVLDVPTGRDQWLPLISVTGDEGLFFDRYEQADATSVLQFLTLDDVYPSSIISSLHLARENARSVRETIASEMWEQLNDFYHWFNREIRIGMLLRSPGEFYRTIMQQCMLFHGITDATMSRGLGWHFANLGRQLERADKISRLLDVKYFTLLPSVEDVNSPLDNLQWSSLLRSVSGFEMYRKRYQELDVRHVVDFLVLDRMFPRSIQYCLFEAERSLHAITGCPIGAFSCRSEQLLGRLCADLSYTEIDTIIDSGIHEFVDDLQARLNQIGEAVFERFFAIAPTPEPTNDLTHHDPEELPPVPHPDWTA
ncbi:MAG: alpha-E domain-containing protein [Planctomycetota bacterium]